MTRMITFEHIKQMFPKLVFERGEQYYKQGRVQGLSYLRSEKAWFAEVEGTDHYYVEISLKNLEHGRISGYCDCPASATYGNCKHVVAVLLELSARDLFQQTNDDKAQRFIDSIVSRKASSALEHLQKVPMQVQYTLFFERNYKVMLKIQTGVQRKYVVRETRNFLEQVFSGESFTFTPKFTYDPHEHYFFQKDLDVFRLIYDFILTGDFFTNANFHGYSDYDKRDIPIPPMKLVELLRLLEERDVTVEQENEKFRTIAIVENEIPLAYSIEKNEAKQLILRTDVEADYIHFPDYQMIFSAGTFYIPSAEQWEMFVSTARYRMMEEEMVITNDMRDQFFSEVVPVLQNVTDLEVDQQIVDEIVQLPLRATLHLQKNEAAIVGELRYHYGSHTIDPFHPEGHKEQIIIRDNEKEREIMYLIEQSNFHYNGEQLYINLENDEEVYEFLYSILPYLNERVELFLTADIKRLIVDEEARVSTNVQLQSDTNLLEVGFDISGIDQMEVEKIIASVIEKKRFYRLQDGAYLSLEDDAFRSLRTLFDELEVQDKDLADGKFTLPVFKGLQVDGLIETRKNYDTSFRKMLQRLRAPEEQVYEFPDGLQAQLRDYQEVGYQWFKALSEFHLGGILADDMGLGKTLQTITYLLSEPSDKPHLIVVPSSVIYNWYNEFQKFAPSLNVAIITGQPEERKALIEEAQRADVWITSYGLVRQDIDVYNKMAFQALILDEAQYIKNYVTKTSKAIREIKAERRFALSGTPIENSIDELWAIFQVVLPGFFPPLKDFRNLSQSKIALLTRPFILRRVKEDVLTELPDKIESVHVTTLEQEQKALYVGYLQKLQEETATTLMQNGFQKERIKILAGLTRLRQICNHPALFMENYDGQSGKLNELVEMVQSYIASGKRMLIFSQFTSMHELIMRELEKLGIDYFYLSGQTPSEQRVQMTEAFNSDEKSVFLISLRAGGTGLNLTGADTVILVDLWWNPAVEDQAASRAHRFGQKKVVHVIRLITEGTIEEKIYQLQQKKRKLIDQVIQPGETMLSSLSEEDIRELLSI